MRGHGEDHSRLREGQTCIPRTWASLVGSSVCELRRDRVGEGGGSRSWKAGEAQVRGSVCTQSTAVTEGLQTGKNAIQFYKTQSAFGVEKGASFGAREKAVFQARGDGGLGQGAAVEVERVGSSESYFECGINKMKI